MKKVHAYGGGVQSVALGRLILEGKFERPDLILFADTGQEPIDVYEAVERESKLFKDAGIDFQVVKYKDLGKLLPGIKYKYYTNVPLFTLTPEGKKGMLRRQCTGRYKIEPMQKYVKSLGWKAEGIEQWLGISCDEITRVKPARLSWITNRYPLIELNLHRKDLEKYLKDLNIPPSKSACVFCPYRNKANWQKIKKVKEDLENAIKFDESIRDLRPGFKCFVHVSRKPLIEALDDPALDLFDEECEGYCGV